MSRRKKMANEATPSSLDVAVSADVKAEKKRHLRHARALRFVRLATRMAGDLCRDKSEELQLTGLSVLGAACNVSWELDPTKTEVKDCDRLRDLCNKFNGDSSVQYVRQGCVVAEVPVIREPLSRRELLGLETIENGELHDETAPLE